MKNGNSNSFIIHSRVIDYSDWIFLFSFPIYPRLFRRKETLEMDFYQAFALLVAIVFLIAGILMLYQTIKTA